LSNRLLVLVFGNGRVLLPGFAIGRCPHIIERIPERFGDAAIDPHFAAEALAADGIYGVVAFSGDGGVHTASRPIRLSVLFPVTVFAAAPHLLERIAVGVQASQYPEAILH